MPWEEAAHAQQMPWEEAAGPKAAPNAGLAPPANAKVDVEMGSPTAGLPGSSPNPQPATEGMTHAAELGIGAAGGALYGPGIARAALPYVLPAAGSYAISRARELPIVGPVLKHIPFAEMLPWIAAGKAKGEVAPEATPEISAGPEVGPRFPSGNMRAQEGEYVESPPIARPNETPFAEAQPVIRPEPAPYRKGPGEVAPEQVGQPASPGLGVRVTPRGNGRLISGQVEPSTPYRMGPGQVAPEDVSAPDPNVLAGRQGVRIAQPAALGPRLALPAGEPVTTAPTIAPPNPAAIADKGKIGDLLNEGLGGKIPEGHR
jgi:hypothetical protein